MYVTVVPVEDLLNEDDLFGINAPTKDVQPRAVVEKDHDPEDKVPNIYFLREVPLKNLLKRVLGGLTAS